MKTDFITWVGDNPAHNIWEVTQEDVNFVNLNLTLSLKEALGPDSEIEIYPLLANHDIYPLDL